MKTISTLLTVFTATAALALGARAAQSPAGGLVRLAPGADDDAGAESAADTPVRDDWRTRLSEPDLAAREASFDELVRSARVDPELRGLLDELVAGDDRELAWTARLALRELDRTGFGARPRALRHTFRLRPDGTFQPGPGGPDLDAWLEQRFPGFGVDVDPGSEGRRLWVVPNLPQEGASRTSRGVKIERGPDGVRVEIQSDVDGEASTRTFEAESLEALLEAHPELAEHLGQGGLGLEGGLRIHIGGPNAGPLGQDWQLFFAGPGGELREHLQPFFGDAAPSAVPTTKLGVRVSALPADEAGDYGLEPGVGLYVWHAAPGTIAHLLGLGTGDVLLELNGRAIATPDDITAVLAARGEHDPVKARWVDALGTERSATWRPH